jgi:hypothetical protein
MAEMKIYSCPGILGKFCGTKFHAVEGLVPPFYRIVSKGTPTVDELEKAALCILCGNRYRRRFSPGCMYSLADSLVRAKRFAEREIQQSSWPGNSWHSRQGDAEARKRILEEHCLNQPDEVHSAMAIK